MTEEGRLGTKMIAQIRNTQKQFLRVGTAKDIDIWTTIVGGKPVKPAKDNKNMVMIPLQKSNSSAGTKPQDFQVKFVYLQNPCSESDKKKEFKLDRPVKKNGECKELHDDTQTIIKESFVEPMKTSGTLTFTLPAIDLPVNHLFVTLHLPQDYR